MTKQTIFELPAIDFMQPELLDEDRARFDVTFTVDQEVGPSGHTTVIVAGTLEALLEFLDEYCDEDADFAIELLKTATPRL